ncbi:hypothetical protein JLT2_27 [Paraglaciecola Antarctic JLT virus 2]|nr:hypothetical protein JLT2_27 [Paraglaciecola Antarctic JLT virus 2]
MYNIITLYIVNQEIVMSGRTPGKKTNKRLSYEAPAPSKPRKQKKSKR